ncbi:MAG: hypothetical protein ABC595_00275 [Candidatus Methanosuratincola petrocarbonis]|nr:hypothetical protein [Synergistales bacterium]
MSCGCVERFRSIIGDRRAEASRRLKEDLPRRLDAFAEAMRLGAIQLVARSLLRAGAFRASLDQGCSREITVESMRQAIPRAAAGRQKLPEFIENHWETIIEQSNFVDPAGVLPKRVKDRERIRESFGGYLDRSLDAAERMLEQLETLERRLPIWKSMVRGTDVPRVEPVMDYHDSLK